MILAYPWMLFLLLLLPLMVFWRRRWGRAPAFLYSSTQMVRPVSGLGRSPAQIVLPWMRWGALVLLVVALSRPRVDEGESVVKASGVDIVVAFDLSTSMKSEDFELEGGRVNRLEVARRVLREFVDRRASDRIGLVAFARNPYIAAPLTLDHDFLLANLDRLTFATREEDGTAIGSALAAAVNRLRDVESKSKIVILMTDGQNNAGKVPPLTAAEAALALKVKVYTIGVGTRGQAPIPYEDAFGRKRVAYQQVDIDEDTLREIADKTGGAYYRADRTETLRSIYDEIDRFEKTEVSMTRYENYRELFPWFVMAGAALLLLELVLSNTVWRTLP